MNGMFSGIDDPGIGVGGDRLYFAPGTYRVKIDVVKAKSANDTQDGIAAFIVECIIVQSSNPSLKPGAVVGWVQKFHKDPKKGGLPVAFARVKGFLAAALRTKDFDQVLEALKLKSIEQLSEYCASEANPLRGVICDLACSDKKGKEGNSITTHSWHPEGALTF